MSDRATGGGHPSRRGLLAAAGTIAVITLVARVVGFFRRKRPEPEPAKPEAENAPAGPA